MRKYETILLILILLMALGIYSTWATPCDWTPELEAQFQESIEAECAQDWFECAPIEPVKF